MKATFQFFFHQQLSQYGSYICYTLWHYVYKMNYNLFNTVLLPELLMSVQMKVKLLTKTIIFETDNQLIKEPRQIVPVEVFASL